jgi:hypothetical protein
MTEQVKFKKDIIDRDIVLYQFYVPNANNILEEVWIRSTYHANTALDTIEFNNARERAGLTNGD